MNMKRLFSIRRKYIYALLGTALLTISSVFFKRYALYEARLPNETPYSREEAKRRTERYISKMKEAREKEEKKNSAKMGNTSPEPDEPVNNPASKPATNE